MEIRDRLGPGPRARVLSGSNRFFTLATVTLLLLSVRAQGQWTSRDGWIEEPAAKSLNVEGDAGRSYLDTASVHRGDDGLVYFSESSNVMRPEEIGKVGFMKDAYDCARNIKYMCVELGRGNWRNDRNSTLNAADEPALPVYRKYLCGDPDRADDSARSHAR